MTGMLRRLLFLAMPVCFCLVSRAQEWRYPVPLDGAIGLIDSTGAVIPDARFEQARASGSGLLAARQGSLWGFVDPAGQWVIAPQYLSVDDFAEERTRARVAEGWIVIDRSGQRITRRAYPEMTPVGGGLAGFQAAPETTRRGRPGQWGILSAETGEVLVDPQFDGALAPSEGLMPASRYRTFLVFRLERRWGYVDDRGRWRVPPEFVSAWPFSDGLGLVSRGGEALFLSAAGDTALTVSHPVAAPFREGLARVQTRDGWGFIDQTGAHAIGAGYLAAGDFSGGLAPVRTVEGWGYVNPQGTMVITPRFRLARVFEGPLARVTTPEGEAYVNRAGTLVWPR